MPSFKKVKDLVSPKVYDAMQRASALLTQAGVPHAVIGGLAVGANGYPRTTKDVDFIVGDEAFVQHGGGVVSMQPGIPYEIHGVSIDYISISEDEYFVREMVGNQTVDGVPVLDIAPLIYLKLLVGRAKDKADVVELLKSGILDDYVLVYLEDYAPQLVDEYNRLREQARSE